MGRVPYRTGRRHPKSVGPQTLEEWAEYGIGEPDENGIYPAYRALPKDVQKANRARRDEADAIKVTPLAVIDGLDAIALDIAERYGHDMWAGPVMPWPWLTARIGDIAGTPGTRFNMLLTHADS